MLESGAAQLEFLVNYKSWADDVLYDALAQLPPEELTKSRPMLFDNMLRLLNHTYSMDCVWRHNLQETGHNFSSRNPEDVPRFSMLRQQQANVNRWYKAFAEKQTVENSHREIAFTFIGDGEIGGGEGRMRIFEVIHHVVNHASYHRGHIEGVLYQIGVEPPTTDMPVYLREQPVKS